MCPPSSTLMSPRLHFLGHVLHQPLHFVLLANPLLPHGPGILLSGALVHHDDQWVLVRLLVGLAHEVVVVHAHFGHLSLALLLGPRPVWRIPGPGPHAMTAPRTIRGVRYLVRVSLLLPDFQRCSQSPRLLGLLSFFAVVLVLGLELLDLVLRSHLGSQAVPDVPLQLRQPHTLHFTLASFRPYGQLTVLCHSGLVPHVHALVRCLVLNVRPLAVENDTIPGLHDLPHTQEALVHLADLSGDAPDSPFLGIHLELLFTEVRDAHAVGNLVLHSSPAGVPLLDGDVG